jgi:hypothetical protein
MVQSLIMRGGLFGDRLEFKITSEELVSITSAMKRGLSLHKLDSSQAPLR